MEIEFWGIFVFSILINKSAKAQIKLCMPVIIIDPTYLIWLGIQTQPITVISRLRTEKQPFCNVTVIFIRIFLFAPLYLLQVAVKYDWMISYPHLITSKRSSTSRSLPRTFNTADYGYTILICRMNLVLWCQSSLSGACEPSRCLGGSRSGTRLPSTYLSSTSGPFQTASGPALSTYYSLSVRLNQRIRWQQER